MHPTLRGCRLCKLARHIHSKSQLDPTFSHGVRPSSTPHSYIYCSASTRQIGYGCSSRRIKYRIYRSWPSSCLIRDHSMQRLGRKRRAGYNGSGKSLPPIIRLRRDKKWARLGNTTPYLTRCALGSHGVAGISTMAGRCRHGQTYLTVGLRMRRDEGAIHEHEVRRDRSTNPGE
ncbi:hypothetical protein CC2G_009923 [Coprinopsis cinerea AmutBmut pab1-1]|nr:hypothetical protein CC2G_009923 [Coprinopsis cinerea AmutBmut pab1-1]